jgi:intracellular sulfur oxidation DsrE/DsrF family protein
MRALTLMLGILLALASTVQAQDARHRLLIHVNSADQDVMVEALHNAANAIDTIRKQGGSVAVEIVANGHGTAMFIEGLSPVKDEVQRIHAAYPAVVMSACAISLAHTETAMQRKLTVMGEARVVPSGAVRIMELEEQHWAYLKP